MSLTAEHIIATFASSIVVARGATSVASIREAWDDARWILFPQPNDPAYQAWQESHGELPQTMAEAEAAAMALIARKRQMSQAEQNFTVL
jgi:hypothetical protein